MPKSKSFEKLTKNLEEKYLGKPVPSKFVNRYGKRYDKEDIEVFAYAIARSRGLKTDRRKR